MNEIEKAENMLPPEPEKKPGKKVPGRKLPKPVFSNTMKGRQTALAFVLMCIITVIAGSGIVKTGASAMHESYNTAFEEEKNAAYDTQYNKYYERAEKEYHLSNRDKITIEDLKEMANLEVLNVSDTEYIISDTKDTGNGITSWLEVPGQGTYIVNLQAAEFIVDNEREYVLVRAPYPEITNISIDYKNVNKLLFQNNIFNESYAVGEDLARAQLNSADLLIKKEFASNQHFYLSAQDAAVSSIQCLVKQLNPTVPDMTVEVEFY